MGENYNRAIEEADRIEKLIIDTLKSGKSFRVEAGAGAGKTHSLNNVVEWIQHNKWEEFKSKKQKVACITYTNAAVDVINERLKADTFIVPSTIHSFAWNLINRYQKALLEIILVKSLSGFSKEDLECVSAIKYDLVRMKGLENSLALEFLYFTGFFVMDIGIVPKSYRKHISLLPCKI